MKDTTKLRAVVYTRVSTDEQRQASHDDQARNCERFAEREGWTVVKRYTDHGISGAKRDRPEYQKMLAAAQAGEFSVLLVDDLSRFARDSVEQETAIRRLERKKVRIVGVSDGYDSTSKARKIHRGMKGLMNEVFLDDLREKTHRGLAGAAERGLSVGGRAYGYRSEPVTDDMGRVTGHKVLVHPEHAKVVVGIFEWYADGKSPLWIAGELNRRGVPSPGARWKRTERRTDAKWMCSAIAGDARRGVGILNNDLYRGVRVWNRSQRVKEEDGADSFERRPESEHVTVRVPELRVVSDELWRRAKARQKEQAERIGARVRAGLSRDEARRTGKRPQYLFSGLLKCAKCASNMVVSGANQSYVCATRVFGRDCANAGRVPRARLEAGLLEAIKAKFLGAEYQKLFADEVRRLLQDGTKNADVDRETRRTRIARLSAEIERYADAIGSGVASATLKERLQGAEAEREQLLKDDVRDPRAAKVVRFLPDLAGRYERIVGEAEHALLQTDVVRARESLRGYMGDVKMSPQKGGGLVAEARLDGAALMRKCLGNQRDISVVAGECLSTNIRVRFGSD